MPSHEGETEREAWHRARSLQRSSPGARRSPELHPHSHDRAADARAEAEGAAFDEQRRRRRRRRRHEDEGHEAPGEGARGGESSHRFARESAPQPHRRRRTHSRSRTRNGADVARAPVGDTPPAARPVSVAQGGALSRARKAAERSTSEQKLHASRMRLQDLLRERDGRFDDRWLQPQRRAVVPPGAPYAAVGSSPSSGLSSGECGAPTCTPSTSSSASEIGVEEGTRRAGAQAPGNLEVTREEAVGSAAVGSAAVGSSALAPEVSASAKSIIARAIAKRRERAAAANRDDEPAADGEAAGGDDESELEFFIDDEGACKMVNRTQATRMWQGVTPIHEDDLEADSDPPRATGWSSVSAAGGEGRGVRFGRSSTPDPGSGSSFEVVGSLKRGRWLSEKCNRFARSKTFAGLVLIAISIYAVVEALDTCQV